MSPSLPAIYELSVTQRKDIRDAFKSACLALPSDCSDDFNDKPTVIADMKRRLQSEAMFDRAITDEEALICYQYSLDHQRATLEKQRQKTTTLELDTAGRKKAMASLKRSLKTLNAAFNTFDSSEHSTDAILAVKAVIDDARIAVRRLSKRI